MEQIFILSPIARNAQFMTSSKLWFFTLQTKSMCHDKRKSQNKLFEYIAVNLDDLYIASPKPEDIVNTFKIKYKIKIKTDAKLSYHLGAKYPNNPGGTMICPLNKYI